MKPLTVLNLKYIGNWNKLSAAKNKKNMLPGNRTYVNPQSMHLTQEVDLKKKLK